MGDIFDKLSSASSPAQTQQPSTGGADVFQSLSSENYQSQSQQAAPQVDEASQTRQMLVSGLTGMPTPNMSQQDIQQFQQGKAAGAVSVPVVAAAATGAGQVMPASIAGAKALGQWAVSNPVHAYLVWQLIKEGVPGIKKLAGIIRGSPEVIQ